MYCRDRATLGSEFTACVEAEGTDLTAATCQYGSRFMADLMTAVNNIKGVYADNICTLVNQGATHNVFTSL